MFPFQLCIKGQAPPARTPHLDELRLVFSLVAIVFCDWFGDGGCVDGEHVWDQDGYSPSVSSFPQLTLAIRASSELACTSTWTSRSNSRTLELFSESI